MKTRRITSPQASRKKRTDDLVRGARILLNLRDSVDQSRARGITLAEARRRLAERLQTEKTEKQDRKRGARARSRTR